MRAARAPLEEYLSLTGVQPGARIAGLEASVRCPGAAEAFCTDPTAAEANERLCLKGPTVLSQEGFVAQLQQQLNLHTDSVVRVVVEKISRQSGGGVFSTCNRVWDALPG